MINEIISGIVREITREFGEGYTVYTEQVKQGLKLPCFFIEAGKPENKQMIGRRFYRSYPVLIKYMPAGDRVKNEMFAVLDRLFVCLSQITADGDLLTGSGMDGGIKDGALEFNVKYGLFVITGESAELMESADIINII